VSPVRYELGSYIPEDILHSHRRENLKSYFCFWVTYGFADPDDRSMRKTSPIHYVKEFGQAGTEFSNQSTKTQTTASREALL
jgi:hypothetical protein